MTTERRAAAKLATPTINLASVVYGLDAYMRSREADADDALRRASLEPGDLTDPDRRCRSSAIWGSWISPISWPIRNSA